MWNLVGVVFLNSATIGFAMLLVPCAPRDEPARCRRLRLGLWVVLDALLLLALAEVTWLAMVARAEQRHHTVGAFEALAGPGIVLLIGPLGAFGLRRLFCGAHEN
jgi:hypothetical protein